MICAGLALIWLVFLYRQVPHGKSPFAKAFDKANQLQLEQGNTILYFHKEKTGWTVAQTPSGPAYPVDDERWHTLSSGLPDVQLEDVISERKESAADFDVDAAGLRVTLRDTQGKVLADGIFGKQAADAAHIYFRYAEGPTVYLARGIFRGELGGADLAPWRNHLLISLRPDAITAFQIQTKAGTLQAAKSSATWTVDNAPADPAKVNAWLDTVVHLRADDFADLTSTATPKLADLHEASLTLHSASLAVVLEIGALDTKGKRFPVSTGADHGIAWISEPRLQAVLLNSLDFKTK